MHAGRPLTSVTVVADDLGTADVLATSLFVIGAEGIDWAVARYGCVVLAVDAARATAHRRRPLAAAGPGRSAAGGSENSEGDRTGFRLTLKEPVVTIFGLPIHPLIVHATVVIVPTAALAVLLATLWPRFRRWASWGPFAAAAAALILVPLTTSSGESLEHSLPHSALIEKHAQLADGLLPWSIALLVGAIGVFWMHWSTGHPNVRSLPRWLATSRWWLPSSQRPAHSSRWS